jgi:hypothetical protein
MHAVGFERQGGAVDLRPGSEPVEGVIFEDGCGWHIVPWSRLYYIKEVQYDEDDGNNDQNVNPWPEVRQGWNYDRAKKAQQP